MEHPRRLLPGQSAYKAGFADAGGGVETLVWSRPRRVEKVRPAREADPGLFRIRGLAISMFRGCFPAEAGGLWPCRGEGGGARARDGRPGRCGVKAERVQRGAGE